MKNAQATFKIEGDSWRMLILVWQMEFYMVSYILSLKARILSHYATASICNLDGLSNNMSMNLFYLLYCFLFYTTSYTGFGILKFPFFPLTLCNSSYTIWILTSAFNTKCSTLPSGHYIMQL